LDRVQKIWTPLRKLFAPPGVPSWLRAWLSCSLAEAGRQDKQTIQTKIASNLLGLVDRKLHDRTTRFFRRWRLLVFRFRLFACGNSRFGFVKKRAVQRLVIGRVLKYDDVECRREVFQQIQVIQGLQ